MLSLLSLFVFSFRVLPRQRFAEEAVTRSDYWPSGLENDENHPHAYVAAIIQAILATPSSYGFLAVIIFRHHFFLVS